MEEGTGEIPVSQAAAVRACGRDVCLITIE
jgi:hypothetical protein